MDDGRPPPSLIQSPSDAPTIEQRSVAGTSDICEDLGETARLFTRAQNKYHNTLVHQNSASDTANLDSASVAGKGSGQPFKLQLQNQLKKSIFRLDPNSLDGFLPTTELDSLVTEEIVLRILKESDFSVTDAQQHTHSICAPHEYESGSGRTKQTTRRKLFAILVLCNKVGEISNFIQHEILDKKLPFIAIPNKETGRYQLHFEEDSSESISCCRDWDDDTVELFNLRQWIFLSPFFHNPDDTDNSRERAVHYKLHDKTVLPFTLHEEPHDSGGFGAVSKIQIHKAQHDFRFEHSDPNPWLALKQLESLDQELFDQEVKALKFFCHKSHPHLIKLFVTFHWRAHYYLVFPWADGNLWGFAKQYQSGPSPTIKIPARVWAEWFATQVYGIASGLLVIHVMKIPTTTEPGIGRKNRDKVYGRHGDLKPENILWFHKCANEAENPTGIGILRISDFGLAEFHGRNSRSGLNANKIAISSTYRAPEYETVGQISQAYDIWTLGCLYLEMATWYLCGYKAAYNDFSDERLKSESVDAQVREDTFYQRVDGEGGAAVKQTVIDWVEKLRRLPECTEYMRDLLDYIMSYMLVLDTKDSKRAKCGQVVSQMRVMLRKCYEEEAYCSSQSQSSLGRMEMMTMPDAEGLGEADGGISGRQPALGTLHSDVPEVQTNGSGSALDRAILLASLKHPKHKKSIAQSIARVRTGARMVASPDTARQEECPENDPKMAGGVARIQPARRDSLEELVPDTDNQSAHIAVPVAQSKSVDKAGVSLQLDSAENRPESRPLRIRRSAKLKAWVKNVFR